MSAYHYTAVNKAGKEQKGMIEADNEKQARHLLRAKGLLPLTLKSVREKKSHQTPKLNFFNRARKLNSKELALMTRQLSTLLVAGLPLEEALLAVGEQSEKLSTKALVLSVRAKVLEGHALASAMREHPEGFSSLYTATIAAGEKSGHLDKVLLRLADYTEQQWQMKQKLKTALIYPMMIVLVAVGIVGFLLQYVVPKMIAVYGNLNQTLPTATLILIAISNFIKHAGLYWLIVLILLIYFFRRMLKKNQVFRRKIHVFLLKIPFVGHAIKTIDTARFSRTLSILSASGVSILEAMSISAQLINTIPIRESVEVAILRVREGGGDLSCFKANPIFPTYEYTHDGKW